MEVLFAKAFLSTPGSTRGFVKPKGSKKSTAPFQLQGRASGFSYIVTHAKERSSFAPTQMEASGSSQCSTIREAI